MSDLDQPCHLNRAQFLHMIQHDVREDLSYLLRLDGLRTEFKQAFESVQEVANSELLFLVLTNFVSVQILEVHEKELSELPSLEILVFERHIFQSCNMID